MDYKNKTGKSSKEITRRDHDKAIENLQIFKGDVDFLDRKFFDFQLAFNGLLGVSLAIIFSNISYFSQWFLISILVVTFLTFISYIYDICREADRKIEALKEMERAAFLANIRNIAAIHDDLKKYGVEAERLYSKEHELLQAMKANKPIDDLSKQFIKPLKWKLHMIWWSLLFLSVPILFIAQLIYPHVK